MSNLPLDDKHSGQPANDEGYAALMAVKPGERLKKARKQRKLDVEAAACQLNLSPSVLIALENDDYGALPSSTFVKGYIRSYARMLGLPGTDLVRAFEYQTGVHSSMDEQHPVPDTPAKKGGIRLLMVVLLALFGAGIAWYVFSSTDPQPAIAVEDGAIEGGDVDTVARKEQESDQADTPNSTALSPPIIEKAPKKQAVTPIKRSTAKPAAVKPTPVLASTVEDKTPKTQPELKKSPEKVAIVEPEAARQAEKLAQEPSVSANSASSSQTVAAAPVFKFENTASSNSKGNLVMTFSEDCWVEIRDQQERLIHADLHRSGSRYSKTLPEPFDIKLGNGNAVEVFYNGTPIAFALSKRSNVARLTIGDANEPASRVR
ncbi:MAG: DUF4115 domain-containing protein [Pseudomonadales bacterium]|nr:DUF4115 domain-containing protein [Pseudomonadales bacterium]